MQKSLEAQKLELAKEIAILEYNVKLLSACKTHEERVSLCAILGRVEAKAKTR